VPEPVAPGGGSKTVVAQDPSSGSVSPGIRIEFESRVLPYDRVRYSVRNLGRTVVRVVWNVPKSGSLREVQGALARSGIELHVAEQFEHDATFPSGAGTRIIRWQTQVAIILKGGPYAIFAAIPAVGPSNGTFEESPLEFWQTAGQR
jgi:hypothetical protein